MKFARAATGRPRLISCDNSFHGVTLGPLSLVGDEFFKEGFGPLLPGCERVPFGDLARLEAELRARDVAAFIVEPIQGRMVTLPPDGLSAGRPGAVPALRHAVRRSTRSRPGSDGPASGSRWSTGDSSRISCSSARRSAAATCRSPRWSRRGRSTRRPSGRSSAATCTSRRSGAIACRWRPAWPRCAIIERDRLVEHAAQMSAVLLDGLAELAQRYEMIKEVRGSGLMIGIELCAPSSRVARLNWRLIHMASEGLFPQLIVIPLHRDHGVITMAAGKNDVIKLLPPLTLSEPEAQQLPRRARRRARRLPRRGEQELGRRARHRHRDAQPPGHARAAGRSARRTFRGKPVDPSRDDVCLVTGATGFIGGRLAQRLVRRGPSGALPRAREQRHVAARRARRRDRRRRPHERAIRSPAPRTAASYVLHCGAQVSDWATTRGDRAHQRRRARATCSSLRRRVGAARRPLQHHGRLRLSRRRGDRRDTRRDAVSQLVRADEAGRRGRGSPRGERRTRSRRSSCARRPSTAPVRPTSSARSRARCAAATCSWSTAVARSPASATSTTSIDAAVLALRHEAAPGQAFNVSDGLDVTWKEFTDGLAKGLGCSQVRWSMPYWMANGDRLLARARLPGAAPDHAPEHAAAALAAGRAGARAQTRTSATARRARCSAGSRASTTRPASQATARLAARRAS